MEYPWNLHNLYKALEKLKEKSQDARLDWSPLGSLPQLFIPGDTPILPT